MKTFSARCDVVFEPSGFVDITDDIRAAVAAAGISCGRATVISREPGCSIFLNENESGLKQDLIQAFERFRPEDGSRVVVGSPSVVIPVNDGDIWVGNWQRVLAHLHRAGDVMIHVWGV